MRKAAWGFFWLVTIISIAYLFRQISMIDNPAAPQAQYAPEMTAQYTATIPQEATGTPTIVFTATIDVQATSNANAIAAAQINLQAAETQAAGVIAAANIEATTEANKAESAERIAQISATAQSERDNAANQGAAIANERVRLEIEAERVKQDERKIIPNILLSVAALIFAIFLFVWLVLSWQAREPVTEAEEVTINELAPEWLQPVVQVNSANQAFQYEGPITPFEAARLVQAGALEGVAISFSKAGKVGIRRARWTILRGQLVPEFASYAETTDTTKSPIVFNAAGEELIRKMTGELQ